jgi:glutamate/aspartate transport system ATP-binding protein
LNAVIQIETISKWYGPTQVLKDCSAEVAKGEVVVVCGPSGSGKSTLIKCVNGLEPFQKGRIVVDGISVGDPTTCRNCGRASVWCFSISNCSRTSPSCAI